jgi:hypothetical protein
VRRNAPGDLSSVGASPSADHVEQSGLSGAGPTNHRHQLGFMDPERGATDGVDNLTPPEDMTW